MSATEAVLGIQIEAERLRITGKDRAKWFHNFCTAPIIQMPDGQATEAFVLNPSGKFIAWVHVTARPDALELWVPRGLTGVLLEHFEKYVIREQVHFEPIVPRLDFFVWGINPLNVNETWGVDIAEGQCREVVLNGQTLDATRMQMIGPGVLLSTDAQNLSDPEAWFSGTGITCGTPEQLASHRIRHGCPRWGIDFNEQNLPQEIRRDDLAISFEKGCYLGQETVARIDALGHVNRWLAVVETSGTLNPTLPVPLLHLGEVVGQLTSWAVDHPDATKGHGLGLIKRKLAVPETTLVVQDSMVRVVEATRFRR